MLGLASFPLGSGRGSDATVALLSGSGTAVGHGPPWGLQAHVRVVVVVSIQALARTFTWREYRASRQRAHAVLFAPTLQPLPALAARVRQTGPSSQGSATPACSARCGSSRRATEETGVQKIRASETNENRVNVVVQIKMLIPAMIASVGPTAFGPPARTRTGNEVRTIVRLRSADLRTMLRRLGAEDSFS